MATVQISEMVAKMNPTFELLQSLENIKTELTVFGKMNSHLQRFKFHSIMEKANLNANSRYLIFFFCCLIKRKRRVLEGMDKIKSKISETMEFKTAYNFIKTNMVDFPDEESLETFATIHVPATNPGMACQILMWVSPDKSMDYFLSLQTTTQINLNRTLQDRNKVLIKKFWEEQIKKTGHKANEANFKKKMEDKELFDESIYSNQANDKYLLLDESYDEINPADMTNGYSESEIALWISKI